MPATNLIDGHTTAKAHFPKSSTFLHANYRQKFDNKTLNAADVIRYYQMMQIFSFIRSAMHICPRIFCSIYRFWEPP